MMIVLESFFNVLLVMIAIVPIASWSEKLSSTKFVRVIDTIISPLTKPFKWAQIFQLDFSYLALYLAVGLIKNIVLYYL